MLSNFFEDELIDALQPIRYFGLATCIYHLFHTGLFDTLDTRDDLSLDAIAAKHRMDHCKLNTFLNYLKVEGIVGGDENHFYLTAKGRSFAPFQPWYTMFIGGYSETFLQIGDKLKQNAGWAYRDLAKVGSGSCGISHFDAIPLTRILMQELPEGYYRLLDLGCGNGLYLVEFCKAFPEIEAWGVEPDQEGFKQALELVYQHHLEKRIHLINDSAVGFLASNIEYQPDFVVLGFVLHEILGQEGEEGVVSFLRELTHRFPKLYLIVIEVDLQVENPQIMRHGLATAYYNPYYLIHPFTQQRLETQIFWEQIFMQSQLEVLRKETTHVYVDSTGLEIGYLLRRGG